MTASKGEDVFLKVSEEALHVRQRATPHRRSAKLTHINNLRCFGLGQRIHNTKGTCCFAVQQTNLCFMPLPFCTLLLLLTLHKSFCLVEPNHYCTLQPVWAAGNGAARMVSNPDPGIRIIGDRWLNVCDQLLTIARCPSGPNPSGRCQEVLPSLCETLIFPCVVVRAVGFHSRPNQRIII